MSGVFQRKKFCSVEQGKEDFIQDYCKCGEGPELIWDGGNWKKSVWVSQWELEGSGEGRRSMDDPAKWVGPGFTHILLYDQTTCVY